MTTTNRLSESQVERIELITDYLDGQISPERIAADFGITPASLERWLWCRGRDDLAKKVHVYKPRPSRAKGAAA